MLWSPTKACLGYWQRHWRKRNWHNWMHYNERLYMQDEGWRNTMSRVKQRVDTVIEAWPKHFVEERHDFAIQVAISRHQHDLAPSTWLVFKIYLMVHAESRTPIQKIIYKLHTISPAHFPSCGTSKNLQTDLADWIECPLQLVHWQRSCWRFTPMPLKDRSFKLERAQNKKKIHEYQHPTIHPNK